MEIFGHESVQVLPPGEDGEKYFKKILLVTSESEQLLLEQNWKWLDDMEM
jgi:hypothetical protein